MSKKIVRIATISLVICFFATFLTLLQKPSTASASTSFDPGYIISDFQFFNDKSMSLSQIQTFLEKQVPACTLGTPRRPAGGISSDPSAFGVRLANVCLRDYFDSVPNIKSDQYCKEIQSSRYSAAEMISMVATSCKISPMVLLVLIQKEQSLISDSWPAVAQYNSATGFNCPDTAPCSVASSGFFKQVYSAARQMQVYTYFANTFSKSINRQNGFNYFVGPNNILFHPNRTCGSSEVFIRNQATANLYIYTPYQPNPSALANLYGSGDSCGAYGNRNFWRIYKDWFGSPTQDDGSFAIQQFVNQNREILGAELSGTQMFSANGINGAHRSFQNFSLYWTNQNGVVAIRNPILNTYASWNVFYGPLSWPKSAEREISSNGINGTTQRFENGEVISSSFGSFVMTGQYGKLYQEIGGVSGPLGWPKSAMVSNSSSTGFEQNFQNGLIVTKSSGPPTAVFYDIANAYLGSGSSSGLLGFPKSNVTQITGNSTGGSIQNFDGGAIFSSGFGTFVVASEIYDFYQSNGLVYGNLGWPTSKVERNQDGSSTQSFQKGNIILFPGGRTIIQESSNIPIDSLISRAYSMSGGINGLLGRQTGVIEDVSAGGINGKSLAFAGGKIFSSSYGTHPVSSGAFTLFESLGGVSGELGWPVGSMTWNSSKTNFEQLFSNGVIVTTSSGPPVAVFGSYFETFRSMGLSSGVLGKPISSPQPNSNSATSGFAQLFDGGAIHSSNFGTFATFGGAGDLYKNINSVSGDLGWPTSNMTTDRLPGWFTQTFENGLITTTASGPPFIVAKDFSIVFLAQGGNSGIMGPPTSNRMNGDANTQVSHVQKFRNGQIIQTDAGIYPLVGGFSKLYDEIGGASKPLGLPTTSIVQVEGKNEFQQFFQNGSLISTSSGPVRYVLNDFENIYNSWGRSRGNLGFPVAETVTLESQGFSGEVQNFSNGAIISSPLGIFPVFGGFYNLYLINGGVRGPLGWPTDSPHSVQGGFEQTFQNGKISTVGGGIRIFPKF